MNAKQATAMKKDEKKHNKENKNHTYVYVWGGIVVASDWPVPEIETKKNERQT